jgi:1,4-alpha-glucan branching enzyme
MMPWGGIVHVAVWLAAFAMNACGALATAEPVTFWLHAPQAQDVQLAGSFAPSWQHRHSLRRGANGYWSVTLDLPPGRYEYLYHVDGSWRHDKTAPSRDDGLGGRNNVLTVPGFSE